MTPWVWIAIAAGVLVLMRAQPAAAAQADDTAATDDDMTNHPGVTSGLRDLAQAIAHAEGFFVAGSIPQRANNPGDLVIPGWSGPTLGDQHISVFPSAADGWAHLYRQLQLIADGKSHVYSTDDTLADMGEKWTQTQSYDWVANVVDYLQNNGHGDVDDSTTLGDLLA